MTNLVPRASALVVALGVSAFAVLAAEPSPGEAWKTNPHHGTQNGATGRPIPCICRYQGRDFRLGDSVCMTTHVGTVIARCDMLFNNTTWAPTDQPCVISRRQSPIPGRRTSQG